MIIIIVGMNIGLSDHCRYGRLVSFPIVASRRTQFVTSGTDDCPLRSKIRRDGKEEINIHKDTEDKCFFVQLLIFVLF